MSGTRPAVLSVSAATAISTNRPASVRLNFLEGLRALAALWVVFSHTWINQCGLVAHTGILGLVTNWLLYSHLAVDVFIVLSGFCLAWSIRRDGILPEGGVWAFWMRRARRLLPPCYLSLVLAVGIPLVLGRFSSGAWDLDGRALAVNVFLVQDLFQDKNVFNGPLWSIAVEWRLSLVFPLLIWLWRHGGSGVLLGAALLVGGSLTALLFWHAPQFWLACPWYLLLFSLGVCAAMTRDTPQMASPQRFSPAGWKMIAAGALVLLIVLLCLFPITGQGGKVFGWHMPVIDLAAGLLTSALLVGLRRQEKDASFGVRVLSWSPLVGLGQFSYSLYLTHVPLLLLLGRLIHHSSSLSKLSPVIQSLLIGATIPLLISCAYLFYLGCERPFIAKRRPPPSYILAIDS